MRWEDDDTGTRRSLVQIRSLSTPNHWLQIQADEHGNFAVDLQPDQYREGYLWFGTGFLGRGGGASRYAGDQFTTFTSFSGAEETAPDQLRCTAIIEDLNGNLWFGGDHGVARYDDESFTAFSQADGLEEYRAGTMLEGQRGNIWLKSTRFDGKYFENFESREELNFVGSMGQNGNGDIWFVSTFRVKRYDARQDVGRQDVGQLFVPFSGTPSFTSSALSRVMVDRDGNTWFGSWLGGAFRYNGREFANFTTADGLGSNMVPSLLQDSRGDIWFAGAGVTRYRPYHTPPPIRLLNVVAERDHGPVDQIELPATQDYLAFEFQGSSFKTRPGQMAYVYQLEGYDDDWQVTRQERVVYGDLPTGNYSFQVKAVDRDLDYSENPATVHVTVHPPYRQIAVLCLLLLSLIGLAVATGYGRRRRRERDQAREQLVQELEEELQVAHDLQMGLMPTESPNIEGLDIAGRCLTANHVGGDCFQYFRRNGKLLVCLADVTGHAMEAAIPVVMFDGILKSQIELGDPLEQLFGRLNRTLCDTLDSRTFVCVAMAEIDLATRATRLANGGCPYPYHYRATTGDIAELQAEAYPLGVRPDTAYTAVEAQLEPGDRLIFCSDGIVEAENAAGQLLGFERTADAILRGCKKGLNAEDLLAQIVDEVKTFSGEVPQGDDQTIVVLQVEA